MHTLIKLGLAAALCLTSAPVHAQVTIYQLNDVYRIDAVDNGLVGGLGRAVTLIEQSRRRGEHVLILHGGDFIAPSLESRYWGGKQMIDAMNFLHAKAPLITVPGNHEFDERSPTMLAEAITASRFPWLASNLRLTTGTGAILVPTRPSTPRICASRRNGSQRSNQKARTSSLPLRTCRSSWIVRSRSCAKRIRSSCGS